MGGSSASTNNTSTTTITKNQSNSAAFNGDMSGHVISGIEGSTIQINQIDGGAVNKALESMYQTSKDAFSFGEEALEVNEAVTKAALSTNENVIGQALTFAQSASDMALGVAKNLSLDSDAATARDANKNMMYTAVAVAVAGAFLAMKK